ncbi:sensor histidine kinase [Paenibacillus sp. CF384]|uniref:cache domain-containing sensor histidine kinase n=1 Tax=Paenibacillus sp. CF384 TaxID=1884382 RepID=UPI00089D5CA7|nr:sensor histidine kinase [Paenibacillus sp. CF384]SDW80399.1 Sensor histidine kinase YesM [Paenibacillus sp. CF384]
MIRKPLSFQHRLMLVILLTVLLPSVLINFLTFSTIKTQMQKDAITWLKGITNNSGRTMDSYIQLVTGITKNPEYDSTLMSIFERHRFNIHGLYGYPYDERVQINGWLSMLREMDDNIYAVNFVDINGNRFHLGKDYVEANKDWIDRTREYNGGSLVWPPVKSADGETVFSVTRTIINPNTFHVTATIQLAFQLNFLTQEDNENFLQEGDLLILDQTDRVIFDLNGKRTGDQMDWNNQEQQFHVSYDSELTGWKLVGMVPEHLLFQKVDQLRKWILLANIVFILLTMVIVYLLSYRLTRPLWNLSKIMQRASKTNFIIDTISFKRKDEIGMISNSFNLMVRRIHDLIDTVTDTERRRKKSEIEALQSQINPHFLYNTLSAITMQAELDENYKISDMSSLLGKLLRYSIGSQEEWVEVKQECDYIRTYIRIMQFRFPLIQFNLQIDEIVNNWLVIRLLIQPIVENAIIHGIVPKGKEGLVNIHVGEKLTDAGDSRLFISVKDSGVGMDQQTVDATMMKLREYEDQSGGIGLQNVYNRIALSYEGDFEFSLESEEGIGTSFYIEIPRRLRNENHDR